MALRTLTVISTTRVFIILQGATIQNPSEKETVRLSLSHNIKKSLETPDAKIIIRVTQAGSVSLLLIHLLKTHLAAGCAGGARRAGARCRPHAERGRSGVDPPLLSHAVSMVENGGRRN